MEKIINEGENPYAVAKEMQTGIRTTEELGKMTQELSRLKMTTTAGAEIKTFDELVGAIKSGLLDTEQIGQAKIAIFKSTSNPEIINNLSTELRHDPSFQKVLRNSAKKEGKNVEQYLKDRGYPEDKIKKMVDTPTVAQNQKSVNVQNVTGDVTININYGAGDIKNMSKETTQMLNDAVKQNKTTVETALTDVTGVDKTGRIIKILKGSKFIRRTIRKGLLKTLLIGGAVSIAAIYFMSINKNDNIPDLPQKVTDEDGNDISSYDKNALGNQVSQWPKPIQDILRNKTGKLYTTKTGTMYFVRVTNTGDQSLDSNGGVNIYLNGKIETVNGSKVGKWTPSQQIQESVLNEQLTDMYDGFTIDKIYNDVDKGNPNLVDLLDMPSTKDDLKSAYKLLMQYKGKPNATKKLFDLYGQHTTLGVGGDIETSIKYIYMSDAEGSDIKQNLLNLVKELRSGKSSSPVQTQPTTGGVLGGIKITWGGTSSTGGSTGGSTDTGVQPTQPSPKMTYHSCSELPFQYGCKSDTIKQVQSWLDMPEKYQTGNFGPITLSALQKDGYDMTDKTITQDIYNQLSQKQEAPQQTTGTTTGNTETINTNQISPDVAPTKTTPEELPNDKQTLAENVQEIKDFMNRLLK